MEALDGSCDLETSQNLSTELGFGPRELRAQYAQSRGCYLDKGAMVRGSQKVHPQNCPERLPGQKDPQTTTQ